MDHNLHHSHNHHTQHHKQMVLDFRRRFWTSLVLSIPVLVLSPFFHYVLGFNFYFPFDQLLVIVLSTIIYLYGGWPFLSGLYSELKAKNPGMMTLVAVAISTTFFYSLAVFLGVVEGKQLLWELVTLVDVMLLGHWIEMKSVMGASKVLEELSKLIPSIAHRRRKDGKLEDVAVENLENGDIVVVKPGEKIPADGVVLEGSSFVNESMITGESNPVERSRKDEVIGGSINSDGSLTIEVKKTGKDSYLSQITELVLHTQASKSRTQNLANKSAFWLTLVALFIGSITLGSWLLLGSEFSYALERTIAVIVIACPHALGLAIPLVVSFSTSLSATNGILIRNRNAFERSADISAVIFDKTGILTKAEFQVTSIALFSNKYSKKEMLSFAASVEAHSEHPIARAVSQVGDSQRIQRFQAIPGKGAEALIGDTNVKVVSQIYCNQNKISYDKKTVSKLNEEGKTLVFVLVNDSAVGVIGLDDVVREEALTTVAKLKERGISVMMLTGDSEQAARRIAEALDIDEYFSEVLPEDKSKMISEVQRRGEVVAMVGDGVNDAPALAQADVGISIGSGTDVAMETADVILVKNSPFDVIRLIDFADRTKRKMTQNLWWATGYNIVALPLAAGVLVWAGIVLSPAVGAVLMSLSTIAVAFNAKMLKINS